MSEANDRFIPYESRPNVLYRSSTTRRDASSSTRQEVAGLDAFTV